MNINASINPKPKWRSRGLFLGLIAAAMLLVPAAAQAAVPDTFAGGFDAAPCSTPAQPKVGDSVSVDNDNADWANSATSTTTTIQTGSGSSWNTVKSGAGDQSYTLAGSDFGKQIRVSVTASNGSGTGSDTIYCQSGATPPVVYTVAGNAPVAQTAPLISPQSTPGTPATYVNLPATLTAVTNGSWGANVYPEPSYTYQWMRATCGGAYSAITGATSSTYAPGADDVGKCVKVQVFAQNSVGGPVGQLSSNVAVPIVPVPSNTAAPTISGTAKNGSQLTLSTGTWSSLAPITSYTASWKYCTNISVAACNVGSGSAGWQTVTDPGEGTLASGTSPTFTNQKWTPAAVAGAFYKAEVTATSLVGSSTATTVVGGGPIGVSAPYVTVAPAVTGIGSNLTVGATLTRTDNGTWTADPVSAAPGVGATYTYQWIRCSAASCGALTNGPGATRPATWSAISGATGSTYTITPADGGSKIALEISTSAAGGSGIGWSAASTDRGQTIAPVNTVAPTVSGAKVGGTASANVGTWTASPVPTYAVQWQLSTSASGPWTDLSTGESYAPKVSDAGKYLRIVVVAAGCADSATGACGSPATTVTAASNPVQVEAEATASVSIDSKPASKTKSRSATFGFASPVTVLRFECNLDGKGWVVCADPKTYSGLARKRNHTFKVRAVNLSGVAGPEKSYTWYIKKK